MNQIVITLAALFITINLSAQKVFTFEKNKIDFIAESTNENLAEYYLIDVNTCDLHKALSKHKDQLHLKIEASEQLSFDMALNEVSYVSEDYTLHNGIERIQGTSVKSYLGRLTNDKDSQVRITVGENGFYGSIRTAQEQYFLEPSYTFNISDNTKTILYNSKDLENTVEHFCLATDLVSDIPEIENRQGSLSNGCITFHIAIATDNEMLKKHGANLEARNIAMVGEYHYYMIGEFDYDIKFDVIEQFIPQTEELDPFSNVAGTTVIEGFEDWMEDGGFQSDYDLGELWLNKPIYAGTFAGHTTLCNPIEVYGHLLPDIEIGMERLAQMAVHEIAHNLGCGHDALHSRTIMNPISVNVTAWSDNSKNSINNTISQLLLDNCLNECSFNSVPVSDFLVHQSKVVCQGEAVQFTDKSYPIADAWSWEFEGGTPAVSSERNPSIIYSTAGTYQVKLAASNLNGNGSQIVKTNYITVREDNLTPAVCSSFQNHNGSGGIRRFQLANVDYFSPLTTVEECYVDNTCGVVINLIPDSYFIRIKKGNLGVLEFAKVFLDKNNDGDFSADELLIEMDGATSSDYVTIPNSIVENTPIRLRVISDETPIVDACHQPTFGQVEDFTAIFTNNCTSNTLANEIVTISPNGVILNCDYQTVLTASAKPAGTTYQWYFNDEVIIDATDQSHEPLHWGYYSVRVFDGDCYIESQAVAIHFDIDLEYDFNIYPGSVELCQDEMTLSADYDFDFDVQLFNWYKDDQLVDFNNADFLSISEPGTYTLEIVHNMCIFERSVTVSPCGSLNNCDNELFLNMLEFTGENYEFKKSIEAQACILPLNTNLALTATDQILLNPSFFAANGSELLMNIVDPCFMQGAIVEETFSGLSFLPNGWSGDLTVSSQLGYFLGGTPYGNANSIVPPPPSTFDQNYLGIKDLNPDTDEGVKHIQSPEYDITILQNPTLSFDWFTDEFETFPFSNFWVEVYDGNSWINILHVTAETSSESDDVNITSSSDCFGSNVLGGPLSTPDVFDISCYSNSSFKVKFLYEDLQGHMGVVGIDNFKIY